MYIVTIKNGERTMKIHDRGKKLLSGSIVQGINTIDSFSFTIAPSNPGFDELKDLTTLVEVYNDNKNRYEFYGRVLSSAISMNEKGMIEKEVVCESYIGFLCDSIQPYEPKKEWKPAEFLTYIIENHNSFVEEHKRFKIGKISSVIDGHDYGEYFNCELNYQSTWEALKSLASQNYDISFRITDGEMYLDCIRNSGETKTTEIAVSKNMKSISKEKDPTSYITRLIPLGGKVKDGEGKETDARLTIESVNDGKIYLDDEEGIKEYGIHVGIVEWDDVYGNASFLKQRALSYLVDHKIPIKYIISTLDLSLLGLDIDDFEVRNSYPIKNRLVGVDDIARIHKKTIDICEETKTTIEIGEVLKSLSDIRRDEYDSLRKINADIQEIRKEYVLNEVFKDEISKTVSLISQSEEEILLQVSAGYVKADDYNDFRAEAIAELALKVGIDENDRIVSMLNASADIIRLTSNRLTINSDNFQLAEDGTITAKNAIIEGNLRAGSVGGLTLKDGRLEDHTITDDVEENFWVSTEGIMTKYGTLTDGKEGYSAVTIGKGGIFVEKIGSHAEGASEEGAAFMTFKLGSLTYELYVERISGAVKAILV